MDFHCFPMNQETKIGKCDGTGCLTSPEKRLSLDTLITWNITKVLEACPFIDLKRALRCTQERLERDSLDGAPLLWLQAEEQHLAGAVLAWRQLGHAHVDSLYEFINSNLNEFKVVESVASVKVSNCSISKIRSCFASSSSFDVKSLTGPVVRLPETRIVMRVENNYQCHFDNKASKGKKSKKDKKNAEEKAKKIKAEVRNKVKSACIDYGIDKEHLPKLSELEETISDLRTRAANISKRKAERVELLERTDLAWKDLELGYERRLKLAEEKAKDTQDQIKRILEERNGHKVRCKALVEDLKKRSAEAEAMREKLTKADKEVCALACERLRLSELAGQDDGAVAAEHCRLTQIDRELEFKEQAERRKIQYLESEVSTARGVTIEGERAIRSDMANVQEQLKQITNEIDKEKSKNEPLRLEIADLRARKVALACDLDNCKMKCDEDMQQKIQLLKSKKKDLAALKEKAVDCQCQLPIDASTEAKRTPSLAANCACETENNPKSCSCTSIRHQLMSDLLGSLFEGLMTDLCATGSLMPCQLLKCLDDGHDWERDTVLKTNLNSYCSQLLIGELNIAISTTIENNHTKWNDGCCDDKQNLKTGVNERDLDERAKKLATQLAEQMFKQRADEFTKKALQIVSSRAQPCHCRKDDKRAPAVYPLLVKPLTTRKVNESSHLKKTINDVAQLREQIEMLKKETIGKDDLKVMEDKLTKIINKANSKSRTKNKNKSFPPIHNIVINDDKPVRDRDDELVTNRDTIIMNDFDFFDVKKKFTSKPKGARMKQTTKKDFKNIKLPSTVGVYICDTQQVSNNVTKVLRASYKSKGHKQQISNADLKKCTCSHKSYLSDNNELFYSGSGQIICPKECVCIHRIPSTTSINEFLDSLNTTESCYQKLQASIYKTDNINCIDSKCFLHEEAKPKVSEYMCDINLNKENENVCGDKFNNIDLTKYSESNLVKTCNGSENISLKSYINPTEYKENYDDANKCLSKDEIGVSEYGIPIKDCSCSEQVKEDLVSAMGSCPNSCVCCNEENLNAREIEINALNLLKEHIKDKIKDLKPNLKSPIPADEEKNIYEDILKEIKKIITDGTFEVLCKCSFENHEGSRQRAYNLLKEYLKIKIKRAQCSCTTKYDQSDKVLPTILDKITELIESDFERLKIKYKDEHINEKCSSVIKLIDDELKNEEVTKIQSVTKNELGSCCDYLHGQNKTQKDNKLAQVSFNFNSQHKSCDPIHGIQKSFNIDKKLSCRVSPDVYYNTNPFDEYVDTFYKRNKPQTKDNKSAQVSFYFNSKNKSSDAIQTTTNSDNIDKKVSCTLGNDIYVTDCNCRYKLDSNYEETSRYDTRVLYFDINDNFFGLN